MITPATTTAVRTAAAPRERLSAAERRDAIIAVAIEEFARGGFAGTSTETIAARAGISQPYLFRLFGTKRGLFIATIERCFEETSAIFVDSAEGLNGLEALQAMGQAYIDLITNHPAKLRTQLQAYAVCDDDAVRAVVSRCFEELVTMAERISGESNQVIATFFAQGMLLNVLATTGVLGSDASWALRLSEGCMLMSTTPE